MSAIAASIPSSVPSRSAPCDVSNNAGKILADGPHVGVERRHRRVELPFLVFHAARIVEDLVAGSVDGGGEPAEHRVVAEAIRPHVVDHHGVRVDVGDPVDEPQAQQGRQKVERGQGEIHEVKPRPRAPRRI